MWSFLAFCVFIHSDACLNCFKFFNLTKFEILYFKVRIWRVYGYICFPGSSVGKESACNAGDPGLIPGWGRSVEEGIGYPLQCLWASPVDQLVKNLPTIWDTWARSLGWEGSLERGTATHSSIQNTHFSIQNTVFWPGVFWPGPYSPWDLKELDMTFISFQWLYLDELNKATLFLILKVFVEKLDKYTVCPYSTFSWPV